MASIDQIIRLRVASTENLDMFPKYLGRIKGVKKVGMHELPGGFVAVEVGVDKNLPKPEAEEFAEELCEILLLHSTVHDAKLEYIYSEEEKVIQQVRWAGRDELGDVLLDYEGEQYIRLDYYLHAMSFEDLGLLDKNMRDGITSFLNGWPQRAQAREAVPRVKSYYDRVVAIREYLRARAERHAPKEDTASVA